MTSLERLRKLEAAATPGPWRSRVNDQRPYKHVAFSREREEMYTTPPLEATDADLIAAMRNALPALLKLAGHVAEDAKRECELTEHFLSVVALRARQTRQPVDPSPFAPCGRCASCRARAALADLERSA